MKRLIDKFLLEWKEKKKRKPLLLRGARQVGKSYAAQKLGRSFDHFIELNLEKNEFDRKVLSEDLDIKRIILQLSETYGDIVPGKTLLFIDEIQYEPQAILALRYFYEHMPELHVIAAGSLLDFAIDQIGLPVGRVSVRYVYPISFLEFLVALDHKQWAKAIIADKPIFEGLHKKIITLVGHYLAIGGMPAAVNTWKDYGRSREVKEVHAEILGTYMGDFNKYARKHQQKYLSLVFNRAMQQLSRRFMFSKLGEYRKRELEPAIALLEKAGIMYRVYKSAGQGIPIGADVNLDDFKSIFLDVGLTQSLLKFDISNWLVDPLGTFGNKGELVEAFVGQELLAYSDPIMKENLYYWRKMIGKTFYEVDYLIQLNQRIVPIEVKSGKDSHLTSMNRFLETHRESSYGIRFWAQTEKLVPHIHTYPLYAIAKPLVAHNEYLAEALEFLLA